MDTGDFGVVQYELLQTGKFSIERDTGVVGLVEVFNSTIDVKYNSFQVFAFDNLRSTGSLDSTATVRVSALRDCDVLQQHFAKTYRL